MTQKETSTLSKDGGTQLRPGDIDRIIGERTSPHGALISILESIQAECGYLPQDALRQVAEKTGRSLRDVYGVATFYKAFSLKPRGRHLVSVCMGTACHVRGAPKVAEEFERQLGIPVGETTADKEFSLETVNCLGACALGPTVVVDGHYFRHVIPSGVKGILDRAREGLDKTDPSADRRIFPLAVDCPRCGGDLMDSAHPIDGHPSVLLTLSSGRTRGWLRLSCLYGSRTYASQHEIPSGTIVQILCPHCKQDLAATVRCPECGVPMASMSVRGGATVHICPRRECKGHMLDLGSGSRREQEDSIEFSKGIPPTVRE
jgi:NADH-quinone oxidoreductase subunit E